MAATITITLETTTGGSSYIKIITANQTWSIRRGDISRTLRYSSEDHTFFVPITEGSNEYYGFKREDIISPSSTDELDLYSQLIEMFFIPDDSLTLEDIDVNVLNSSLDVNATIVGTPNVTATISGTIDINQKNTRTLVRNNNLTTTPSLIRSGAGTLREVLCFNTNQIVLGVAGDRFLKFYDKATTPTNLNTEPELFSLMVVGGSQLDTDLDVPFTNGLWVAATTSEDDTATTFSGTGLKFHALID